jgi:hypothetical protein
LKYSLVSPVVVSLYREASQVRLLPHMWRGGHAVLTRTFRPWMSVSGRSFSEDHAECIIYDAMIP